MNEILIGAGTTAFGALLSWWLTNLTTRRTEAKAGYEATRTQADALMVAVFELRGQVNANEVLWESRKERLRVGFLAAVAGWGGVARALMAARKGDRDGVLPLVVGFGEMAGVVERNRRNVKLAAAGISPAVSKIVTAAAPLLRHSDPTVAAAAEALTTAVRKQAPTLDDALGAFGRAVAHFLEPRPPWWRRLLPGGRRLVRAVGTDRSNCS